ncbi:MAG: hypothetical protein E5W74_35425, partial [Mesorhizobium sp.]
MGKIPIPAVVEVFQDAKKPRIKPLRNSKPSIPNSSPMPTDTGQQSYMVEITTELEKLLAVMPGPVSIVAGIAVLRAIGVHDPDGDLQATIGTFAAERGRAIRFD